MRQYKYSHAIHSRLSDVRKALDLSQREMADRMGFSNSVYSRHESKLTAKIPKYFILLVCYVFNVNFDYLVFGEGPMFNERDAQGQKLNELFDELSDPGKECVLEYAEFKVSKQKSTSKKGPSC